MPPASRPAQVSAGLAAGLREPETRCGRVQSGSWRLLALAVWQPRLPGLFPRTWLCPAAPASPGAWGGGRHPPFEAEFPLSAPVFAGRKLRPSGPSVPPSDCGPLVPVSPGRLLHNDGSRGLGCVPILPTRDARVRGTGCWRKQNAKKERGGERGRRWSCAQTCGPSRKLGSSSGGPARCSRDPPPAHAAAGLSPLSSGPRGAESQAQLTPGPRHLVLLALTFSGGPRGVNRARLLARLRAGFAVCNLSEGLGWGGRPDGGSRVEGTGRRKGGGDGTK